jgi:hypothetical protein
LEQSLGLVKVLAALVKVKLKDPRLEVSSVWFGIRAQ